MPKKQSYSPPYELNRAMTHSIAEISEAIGRITAFSESPFPPKLRRENRIKTIHASLAIENNTLTLEQVTAIIAGEKVIGDSREIQEVTNAFSSYEVLDNWTPDSLDDLLAAHALIMKDLTPGAGTLRKGNVGVYSGDRLVHMPPPAEKVPGLMADLLKWIRETDEHPLVVSCVFHYELEFIHPFADGNGRMGRLWQTLILKNWKHVFAWLPVETVIKERQKEYYSALGESDKAGNSSAFIDFLLRALASALSRLPTIDQASDQVTDQVKALMKALENRESGTMELMKRLRLTHRPTFRKNYLSAALQNGFVEMNQPKSPRSPNQRYRLTKKGKQALEKHS